MKPDFFKFPSTPHLATLPGVDVRGDKVLTEGERSALLARELTVEEKVDGANLGISFDSSGNMRAQNRGEYLRLPGSGQWRLLGDWLKPRTDGLFDALSDRYILFGEWCYARHSVRYDRLPDWFLGFDVLDKRTRRFVSAPRRDAFYARMDVEQVPFIARGQFDLKKLVAFMGTSALADRPAEGVYLRSDRGEWLARRAKLVSQGFVQSVQAHWSRSLIEPNRLRFDTGG